MWLRRARFSKEIYVHILMSYSTCLIYSFPLVLAVMHSIECSQNFFGHLIRHTKKIDFSRRHLNKFLERFKWKSFLHVPWRDYGMPIYRWLFQPTHVNNNYYHVKNISLYVYTWFNYARDSSWSNSKLMLCMNCELHCQLVSFSM